MQQSGGTLRGRSLAARGPYGLEDVQGWALGETNGGRGDQLLRIALHTISMSTKQFL